MIDDIKRESDLKVGKKYKISWGEEFSISEINFYEIRGGFKSNVFLDKYKEVLDKKKHNLKFEFLGMFYEDSPHFYVELAKINILGEELLIHHKMIIRK